MMQAPFWTQGLNRYSYVFNNPVNNIDPDGFQAVPIYASFAPPVTSRPPPQLPMETGTISGTGSMASTSAASSTTAAAGTQAAAAGQAAGQAAHQAAANAGASGAASSSIAPDPKAAAGTAGGMTLGRLLSQLTGGGNKVGDTGAPTATSGDAPLPRSSHDATGQLNQNFLGQNKGNPEMGLRGREARGRRPRRTTGSPATSPWRWRLCRSREAGFHAP